ncbi:MAG TPA: hypothetical protein VG455_11275 [Acidimicrobiales bacterium]|nr:hypothetical protein [Acidimicrobiales bacterium]
MAKKAAASKTRQRMMSDEHKAALAEGREQGRVVRRYLEALESHRPKRGRKRTPESIAKRLATIDEQLATADPLNRLHLVQERLDLEGALASSEGDGADLEELEAAFVEVAAAYGERKGLTYEAWRSIGVAPRVLKAAGIGRGQ